MMIAQDTRGRKVSGRTYVEPKHKLGGHTPEGTTGRATSSVKENDVHIYPAAKKQQGKAEFTNVTKTLQDAFQDKEDIRAIKESGSKGVKTITSALTSNPVSRLASDPLKELKDEMKMVKNAAGTIVKAVTGDEVDFTEPQDTPEKQKAQELLKGLRYIDEGIRKGADRVKKRLKKIFNHPEWYTRYPEFITTNLNYGVKKEKQYFPVSIGTKVLYSLTVPQRDGVVSQSYIDQMHALFQKLRGSNSGAFNYTVEDLAAYIECVRGIYALHTKLVRDIQAINNVDFYVNKTPYALMAVLGYSQADADAIIANKSIYVAMLNQIGNTIYASFPLPPQMAVFDRDHYLSKVILEDGKGPKSSIFAYVLGNCTIATTTNGKVSNLLISGDMASQISTLKQMISRAHTYLSATYPNADTFAKIAGDTLKAYGQAAFRAVDQADLVSRAAVAFDEYLLHQLQNSNSAAFSYGAVAIKTTDTLFALKYSNQIYVPGDTSKVIPITEIPIMTGATSGMIINSNKSDISGAETLSLTRGNYTLKPGSASNLAYNTLTSFDVDTVGTDAIQNCTSVYYDNTNNITIGSIVGSYGRTALGTNSLLISHWAQVDYMPPIYIFRDSDNYGYKELVEDLDTYAFMTRDQLAQFNDTCVISLYKTVDISDQVNFRAVKR